MKVLVVDYGLGNLASVRRACEREGASVVVSDEAAAVAACQRLILPGVGNFREAMLNLRRLGLVEPLQAAALRGVPLLGICLGMQLLASEGWEGSQTPAPGLNLIPGQVIALTPTQQERIPHAGWNEVHPARPHPLLEDIEAGKDFYFVHSFHFKTANNEDSLATTPYCGGFSSIVNRRNVVGTQFHPEKSSKIGGCFLKNFLRW
ncbi:imidazole glycerol phosphate synthase subunit HisH [bacterium]|nr:imidazole glycerol phosphate synthase subunit HisH [bacterium]